MRPGSMCVIAVLASLTLVTLPPPLEAQSTKDCRKTCKIQKKSCLKGFQNEFKAAKGACNGDFKAAKATCKNDLTGADRKTCIKDAKTDKKTCLGDAKSGKAGKKLCKKGSESSFKECKTCCQGEDLASCSVQVCGDGVVGAGEGCDDGFADNSDTAADACRENCQPASCGDGVVDPGFGEQCEPPSTDICDPDCRTPVLPPTTSTSSVPASTTTSTTSFMSTTTVTSTTTSTTSSTTTTVTSTTTTTLSPPTCLDPSRTIPADGAFRCREFDGDPDSCALAWTVTTCASSKPQCMVEPIMAVSCHYDTLTSTCEGCGPNNQDRGACVNTCAQPPATAPLEPARR